MKDEIYRKIIEKQKEYIVLLEQSEGDLALFASTHGINVSVELIEKGKVLREEISLLLLQSKLPITSSMRDKADDILHGHIDKESMDELSVNVWPDMIDAMFEFANLQPVPAPLRREEIKRIFKNYTRVVGNTNSEGLKCGIFEEDFKAIIDALTSQEVESPAENNAKEVSEKYYKMGMMQGFRILQSYLNFSEQKEFGFQNPDKMLKRIDSEFKKAIIG